MRTRSGMASWTAFTCSGVAGIVSVFLCGFGRDLVTGYPGIMGGSPCQPGWLAVCRIAFSVLYAFARMDSWSEGMDASHESMSAWVMSTSRMAPKYGRIWFSTSLRTRYRVPSFNGLPR